MTWKNVGHFIASIGIGIWDRITNQAPANPTTAVTIGEGIGTLLANTVPDARPVMNAAVTVLGDFHEAASAITGVAAEIKAGQKIEVVVSDALAAAYNTVIPDIQKAVSAFESAIGPANPQVPAA